MARSERGVDLIIARVRVDAHFSGELGGALLDVAHPDVAVIAQYEAAMQELPVPLGRRGRLFDTEWDVIGALARSDGDADWTELLLFNPYAGYRWLVLSEGEWTFGTMLAGFVLLCLWGWRDVLATDWTALPAIVWICLVYVAVAASSMTFVLLQFATLRLPSAKVMAYTYLVPSWVILWELALGRAAPPPTVLVGVALTVLALVLLLKDEAA